MNNTLLPCDLEINYRKTYYKNIQNVLDGIIFCAICNSDLKQNIILNDKIMVHKKFLCLCCKNCFEKLSDSSDDCILCSTKTKLKTCEICKHHMCQRCIYTSYMKSSTSMKLKGCLNCSCHVLWSLRSQTMAVLKCYSFELDSRLLLNGEESENKQRLYELLKNSAKSNEYCTPKILNDIRIKYFYDQLISETQPLYDEILKLEIKNIGDSIIMLNKLCKQILENTCSVLFDIKCLFNDQIVESLYTKIKSLLNGPIFFESNENNYKECLKFYHETKNALKGGLNKTCYVSLVKLDEENLKPYILKMNKWTIEDSEKINLDKKNPTHFSMETQSQQDYNFNSTCVNSNQSNPTNFPQNIFMSLGEVEIKSDKKIKDHHVKKEFEENEWDERVNQVTTRNTNFHSNDEKLNMCPVVYLQKLDSEFISNTTGNICKNKSASIIGSQNIECNKTVNLNNNNEGLDYIYNSYKFDEKYNNSIVEKSKNKKNKKNCEKNATNIARKTNHKKKRSIQFDSKQTYYLHKKFRREERLKKILKKKIGTVIKSK